MNLEFKINNKTQSKQTKFCHSEYGKSRKSIFGKPLKSLIIEYAVTQMSNEMVSNFRQKLSENKGYIQYKSM